MFLRASFFLALVLTMPSQSQAGSAKSHHASNDPSIQDDQSSAAVDCEQSVSVATDDRSSEQTPATSGSVQSIPSMNNASLDVIIRRLDPDAQGGDGYWQLRYADTTALVITDQTANRMRIVSQVATVESLDKAMLFRLLQANFDTALDARYAIAQDILWSTFIHPLGSLDEQAFVSAFAQTITLTHTFGESYSSGALRYRGGDTEAAQQELYRQILEDFESGEQAI